MLMVGKEPFAKGLSIGIARKSVPDGRRAVTLILLMLLRH